MYLGTFSLSNGGYHNPNADSISLLYLTRLRAQCIGIPCRAKQSPTLGGQGLAVISFVPICS